MFELFENSFLGLLAKFIPWISQTFIKIHSADLSFRGLSVFSSPQGPRSLRNSPGQQGWPVSPGLHLCRSLKKINRKRCHQSESADSLIHDRFLYANDTRPFGYLCLWTGYCFELSFYSSNCSNVSLSIYI